MVHDDVGRHLAAAGSFERAAVPLGMYVAWLANHHLLSTSFAEQSAALVTRVRMRDVTGSELAVAGCGGVLESAHLNPEGEAFTARYYPGYLDDFRAEFGDDPYAVKDDWTHYDRIAPRLTRALMRFRGQAPAGGRKPWWRFW